MSIDGDGIIAVRICSTMRTSLSRVRFLCCCQPDIGTQNCLSGRDESVFHNGVRDTLNWIRKTHWVLRGREAVKRVVKKGTIFRRFEGKSFAAVPLPDLPPYRICEGPPFLYTGIDFAGPLYINTEPIDWSTWKGLLLFVHLCVYTCYSSRANWKFDYDIVFISIPKIY